MVLIRSFAFARTRVFRLNLLETVDDPGGQVDEYGCIIVSDELSCLRFYLIDEGPYFANSWFEGPLCYSFRHLVQFPVQ